MNALLCLESSAEPTVIGVMRGDELLVEHVFSNRDEFAQRVGQAIREANVAGRDLEAIAIGIGPGSFTGLRVSLAFAKGMARGLSIPILPVSSFKVIAANVRHETDRIGVITHARRGQVHFVVCQGAAREFVDGPRVIAHEELLSLKDEMSLLLGPGVKFLSDNLRAQLAPLIPSDDDGHRSHAASLAQLARAEWRGQAPPDASSLVPEYGLEFGA
jgi:tRNA threonylcarbamoyladenosine biosynthesis protein TsaB